jgi:hypothetical protein
MDRRNFCKTGLAGAGVLALAGNLQAIERSVFASDKKQWALLYGSQCGSTKEYAGYINEGLGGIADLVDIATTVPSVNDYEYFIIGGWRNGNDVMPAGIPNYIKGNNAALKSKIKGLFVVLGNNGNATLSTTLTQFLNDKMVTPAGVTNVPSKVLFGRSDPQCNGLGFSYNNVKKEAGVDFGKSIVATHTRFNQQGFSNGFELLQNHPNPFSGITTIRYRLPEKCTVQLSIKSLDGKELVRLVSGKQDSGSYEVVWNARDFAPGYYMFELKTGRYSLARSAALIR